jgi:hypothetical protein
MKIKTLLLALLVTLAFGSSAFGHDDERMCSPGWYKNNGLDTWYGLATPAQREMLLAMLNANGKSGYDDPPGVVKNAAADYIVENFVGYGRETCEEAYD